jgi:L-aspartate oxidase
MDAHVGLRRTPEGLQQALHDIRSIEADVDAWIDPSARRGIHELRAACTGARLIAEAAAANETSVGCHYMERPDAPSVS